MTSKEKNELFDYFIQGLLRAEKNVARLLLNKNWDTSFLNKNLEVLLSGAYVDIYKTILKEDLPKRYKKDIDKAWKKLRKEVINNLSKIGLTVNKTYKGQDVINFMKQYGGLQIDNLTRKYANEVYTATIEAAYSVDFDNAIEHLSYVIEGGMSRYAKTLVETSWRTMENNYTLKLSEKAGIEYFRYDGPVDGKNRVFCSKHVGKVYSINEINKMVNDFGQPVLYFRGGWNCRHYWTPVIED